MQRDEQATPLWVNIATGKVLPPEVGMHWIDADAVVAIATAANRPKPTVEQRVVAALCVAASGERASAVARGHLMHPISSFVSERLLQDRAELVLQIAARAMLRRLPPECLAQISQELEGALDGQFPRPQALDGGNHFRPAPRPQPLWETGL